MSSNIQCIKGYEQVENLLQDDLSITKLSDQSVKQIASYYEQNKPFKFIQLVHRLIKKSTTANLSTSSNNNNFTITKNLVIAEKTLSALQNFTQKLMQIVCKLPTKTLMRNDQKLAKCLLAFLASAQYDLLSKNDPFAQNIPQLKLDINEAKTQNELIKLLVNFIEKPKSSYTREVLKNQIYTNFFKISENNSNYQKKTTAIKHYAITETINFYLFNIINLILNEFGQSNNTAEQALNEKIKVQKFFNYRYRLALKSLYKLVQKAEFVSNKLVCENIVYALEATIKCPEYILLPCLAKTAVELKEFYHQYEKSGGIISEPLWELYYFLQATSITEIENQTYQHMLMLATAINPKQFSDYKPAIAYTKAKQDLYLPNMINTTVSTSKVSKSAIVTASEQTIKQQSTKQYNLHTCVYYLSQQLLPKMSAFVSTKHLFDSTQCKQIQDEITSSFINEVSLCFEYLIQEYTNKSKLMQQQKKNQYSVLENKLEDLKKDILQIKQNVINQVKACKRKNTEKFDYMFLQKLPILHFIYPLIQIVQRFNLSAVTALNQAKYLQYTEFELPPLDISLFHTDTTNLTSLAALKGHPIAKLVEVENKYFNKYLTILKSILQSVKCGEDNYLNSIMEKVANVQALFRQADNHASKNKFSDLKNKILYRCLELRRLMFNEIKVRIDTILKATYKIQNYHNDNMVNVSNNFSTNIEEIYNQQIAVVNQLHNLIIKRRCLESPLELQAIFPEKIRQLSVQLRFNYQDLEQVNLCIYQNMQKLLSDYSKVLTIYQQINNKNNSTEINSVQIAPKNTTINLSSQSQQTGSSNTIKRKSSFSGIFSRKSSNTDVKRRDKIKQFFDNKRNSRNKSEINFADNPKPSNN